MGIVNVTPDSFSDGGDLLDTDRAIAAAHAMVRAGADIIDIGGETTRPHSTPTSSDVECNRILPVIRALAAAGIVVSVDTRHAATMRAALAAGASLINDISALADPGAAAVIAAAGCPVVLMHMRGEPRTMHDYATYGDVVSEVAAELRHRIDAARQADIARDKIVIDPGLGFAKTATHNLYLLSRLDVLCDLGYPVLVGASRKRFIDVVAGATEPKDRLPGSLAAALHAVTKGARLIRVHDVPETVQALRVWQAIQQR
jgi:dihydropteroate synthase